jgi:lipopolysaccharide biosynthesis regulator YciM
MEFDPLTLLLALPLAFGLGWLASRLDLRQARRDARDAPRAWFKGLNLLLNEQQDKAIDAFIEAVQHDPDTTELHFALGNLFRRRGEFERAVRVHQHLLSRADLKLPERDRAQHALAQDFAKAGLFDRAEAAWRALLDTPYDGEARLALLSLYERSRDWPQAAATAAELERRGGGSFAVRVAHYFCEQALEADAAGRPEEAAAALAEARRVAPEAPRPLLVAGQRALQAGQPQAALEAWEGLRQRSAALFALVAEPYAQAALAAGRPEVAQAAHAALQAAYAAEPRLELLAALDRLEEPPASGGATRRLDHLAQQPSLGAAAAVLALELPSWRPDTRGQLQAAVQRAARPLQRYRCAACGFEAHHYFWQCPGCQGWDTYPPRLLEQQ